MNTMNSTNSSKEFSKIPGEVAHNLGHSFEEISNKVAGATSDLGDKAMSTIKRYPLHTALAAGAVGFIAGALVARK